MNVLDLQRVAEIFTEEEENPFHAEGYFGDGLDEQESTLWEDLDWWTNEPVGQQQQTVLAPRKQEQIAQETFEASTPGSAAQFQAAEAVSMQRYRNGRVPIQKAVKRGEFVEVGPDQYLRADAGRAFKRAQRAAKKDGVNLAVIPGAGNAYRDYQTQVRLYQEKGDSDTGGLAADPGTSNHGLGIATDILPEGREWMAEHGEKYGFKQLPTESWHFDYVGGGEVNPNVGRKRDKPVGRQVRLHKTPGRELGVTDLAEQSPLAMRRSMADAIMGMTTRPVVVERGKTKPGRVGDVDVDPGNIESIKDAAKRLLEAWGWGDQWDAFDMLVNSESGWNYKADNPTSTAIGIPQRLESKHPFPNKKARKKFMTDPIAQLRWMMAYVEDRYGSPEAAWQHKLDTRSSENPGGWY